MKYAILLVFICSFFLGCKKEVDCTIPLEFDVDQTRVALEGETIDKYLLDSGITAQTHATGLRYVIHELGVGNTANLCSLVVKQYSLTLLDGTPIINTLGGSSAERTSLGVEIPAWKIGIPLVQDGGLITLYVPSPLGYGNTSRTFNNDGLNVTVPPNSIVVFKIAVMSVE